MITGYILQILLDTMLWIVHGLFLLIPDFNFLTDVQGNLTGAFSWFLGILNFMDPIVPVGVSLTVLGVYFGFYFFHFMMMFISWILRKIPALGLS